MREIGTTQQGEGKHKTSVRGGIDIAVELHNEEISTTASNGHINDESKQ
jgi:hypothetical protein